LFLDKSGFTSGGRPQGLGGGSAFYVGVLESVMQLTAREAKMVAGLRKSERLWPRTRWVLLGAGIFAWAVYGYIAFSICDSLQSSDTGHDNVGSYIWLVGFAMMWPKCLLGFVIGSYLIVLAIKDWHGNVNRVLLLKLLDAQEKQADDPGT
jgi:hypothetical protein